MTLVERFIEINGWSTSRKTALLAGLALPTHIINSLIAHAALARQADAALMDKGSVAGALALAICFIGSLFAIRAGKEGRWTAYLLVVLYGPFFAFLNYEFGSWSSPFISLSLLSIILIALYYGEQIGWFAFFSFAFLQVLSRVLEVNGVLPYAPGLLNRSAEAQQTNGWLAGVVGPVATSFLFCFVICLLVVAAQDLQSRRLQEAQKLIRRYMPSQLADKIIKGEYSEVFRPERTKLTIFFSDVEGFTDSSDSLDPEDLAAVLNEYLSEMTVIAERYGATINQFVGDGIMIFFGAPQATNDRDHALRAVRMALEMQRRMLELKDVWVQRGIRKPFRARIGINTGHASVGDFGSPGRKMYSAIGVQTNIAARIQAHCEPGRVLISDSTWSLVREDIACIDKGELQMTGVHYPVRVYEVAETADAASATASPKVEVA
jgi:adenylate cyclase